MDDYQQFLPESHLFGRICCWDADDTEIHKEIVYNIKSHGYGFNYYRVIIFQKVL